jgi:hypothetical protein
MVILSKIHIKITIIMVITIVLSFHFLG